MRLFLSIALTLTLSPLLQAQEWVCGPGGCRMVGSATYFEPAYVAPAYSQPVYSRPTVAANGTTFSNTFSGGVYRAVDNGSGAQWRWQPYSQSWVLEGYAGYQQPAAIIQQNVYVQNPRNTRSRTYANGGRCQCGCVNCQCVNCRCGR